MRSKENEIYELILELYKKRKNKEVVEKTTKFLNTFYISCNKANSLMIMRAKSLRYLGQFDKSIEELKNILNKCDTRNCIYIKTELFYIYYHLNRYEEAMELLPELYNAPNKNINNHSLLIMDLVMKKSLGMPIKYRIGSRSDYLKKQIVDYNENLAIEHIKQHASYEEGTIEHSVFNESLDIEYLFQVVKENLKNSEKANINETLEIYYFSVHGIGYENNSPCSCLKVVVCPNTKNIITMYPYSHLTDEKSQPLIYDHNKLFKAESKQKVISRIDKFNKRYNR